MIPKVNLQKKEYAQHIRLTKKELQQHAKPASHETEKNKTRKLDNSNWCYYGSDG
jgi:hypothetical protein